MEISGLIFLVVLLMMYFIPTVIGATRGCEKQEAIFALNLFLGWTILGWIGALIWALAGKEERE